MEKIYSAELTGVSPSAHDATLLRNRLCIYCNVRTTPPIPFSNPPWRNSTNGLRNRIQPHYLPRNYLIFSLDTSAPIINNPNILEPIRLQIDMGWHHLMHGHPHTSFRSYMHLHYTSTGSCRTTATWTKKEPPYGFLATTVTCPTYTSIYFLSTTLSC